MTRWAFLAFALLAACRTAVYEPASPRRALGPRARLELGEVRFTSQLALSVPTGTARFLQVRLRGADLTDVRDVYLNSAYADGCAGQRAALEQQGDTLLASFRLFDVTQLRGPTTIDVADSAGASCTRLVLASGLEEGALRETGRREWFLLARLATEWGNSRVSPSHLGVMLGSGSWVGPLRVSLATGLASSTCHTRTCSPELVDEVEDEARGFTLPVDLETEANLYRRNTAALGLALRAGLRVSWFERAYTDPLRTAFTPALALRYWASLGTPLRWPHSPRQEGFALGFEVPVGLRHELDSSVPMSWYAGLGAVVLLPVD